MHLISSSQDPGANHSRLFEQGCGSEGHEPWTLHLPGVYCKTLSDTPLRSKITGPLQIDWCVNSCACLWQKASPLQTMSGASLVVSKVHLPYGHLVEWLFTANRDTEIRVLAYGRLLSLEWLLWKEGTQRWDIQADS